MTSDYARAQEIAADPADTPANLGFVLEHLQRELDGFRLDVDLVAIERLRFDEKVRWGVSYGRDRLVIGVGDTLVEAVVQALDRSGHEWA